MCRTSQILSYLCFQNSGIEVMYHQLRHFYVILSFFVVKGIWFSQVGFLCSYGDFLRMLFEEQSGLKLTGMFLLLPPLYCD